MPRIMNRRDTPTHVQGSLASCIDRVKETEASMISTVWLASTRHACALEAEVQECYSPYGLCSTVRHRLCPHPKSLFEFLSETCQCAGRHFPPCVSVLSLSANLLELGGPAALRFVDWGGGMWRYSESASPLRHLAHGTSSASASHAAIAATKADGTRSSFAIKSPKIAHPPPSDFTIFILRPH
jgi:hypothetical protein